MSVVGAKPSVNEDVIRYQARTVLGDLAFDISKARKLNDPATKKKIKKAKMIRLWLKALDYKAYLSREQREKIWYALIHIAGVNDFPLAPILQERSRPDILIGSGGGGDTIINNTYGSGETFINSDVDTPSEVLDSFIIGLSNGARWEYTIINSAGTILRKGSISVGWLNDGTLTNTLELSTSEIGDTSPVVLSVAYSAGSIQLIATVSSNNWIVKGTRYLD
jgi:hypothetical protein